jgi:NADPH:quinone reductase-like Zn-dependent oxidoreductase
MPDGAGEVAAVGSGVTDFAVGDHVVSTFYPGWLDGETRIESFAAVLGDGVDGYAREVVTASARAFTRAPHRRRDSPPGARSTRTATCGRATSFSSRARAGCRSSCSSSPRWRARP